MKKVILKLLMQSMKLIKWDYYRYIVLKPLFKLNHQNLHGFTSLFNDRFFVYKVNDKFLPSQALHWPITYKGFEDWCDSTALYGYEVKEGDFVLDIGAGMGEEILVLSNRVGQTGKIYAIEANPKVYNVLQTIVKKNCLNNVELHNIAISSADEDISLIDDADSYLAGSIQQNNGNNGYIVQGKRVDTFFKERDINKIDLLKSNIEGAERFVVDSISKDNLKKIKRVAISCHDFRYRVDGNEFYKTKEYISDFLINNGFEITCQKSGIGHIDDYVYGVNKFYSPV
ncbi:FkbM family methyltransferase [Hymenobacter oligotrophus]|uniref:FkbM family methyltransferase n=1 Tax=Hymenobacter oligotrophus TaxID=2319843 RepID=A0A3B7R160_9BACT|nr:FkbM family methyltransferase [Hymenobacter oligotrophus]AYA37153.1 FkbM family methyltransferase [Hymenobacter oligotrophus]